MLYIYVFIYYMYVFVIIQPTFVYVTRCKIRFNPGLPGFSPCLFISHRILLINLTLSFYKRNNIKAFIGKLLNSSQNGSAEKRGLMREKNKQNQGTLEMESHSQFLFSSATNSPSVSRNT